MVASRELIQYFEKVQVPWSASVMSLAAAEAILEYQDELKKKADFNRKSVEFFCTVLGDIPGVKPFHSHGNYILVDATDTGKSSKEIVDRMYGKGFIIKTMPVLHGRKGFFRITPGTEKENQNLAKALKEFFVA
jgi:threonine-phosphate decarboxylase